MAEAGQPYSPDAKERECFQRWHGEITFATKDPQYIDWQERSKRIVERYRDKRNDSAGGGYDRMQRRFNVLWSNVQTLTPAVYARPPKPIAERRFMDRDPAGRLASQILERTLSFQMEVAGYSSAHKKAVLDYLLPGIGVVWARYERPEEAEKTAYENDEVEKEEKTAYEIEEEGDGTPYTRLAYEKVCIDHVNYRDFLWGPARCWYEVPWVGRRSWLTRSELEERFGEEKAKAVVLDYVPDRLKSADEVDKAVGYFRKAEIWEIWNKPDHKVYFIAPATPGMVLEERDDPLKLEGFWPCPEPLFATQTNDTIIPVPDYVEYQDQALELDDLTNRIAKITTAVRANGVYNASYPALVRLLEQGVDNSLLPVDEWAAFAEKGGMQGAVALLPMQEIIEVLLRLYEARAQVKNDLFEITGMSDIVRGQGAGGPAKTATEQRIKGQYATLRLQDRQEQVARFCRDSLRIMAEIVAEVFSPESLMEMSGYPQTIADEERKAVEAVQQPQIQPPQPPMGQDGQPMQLPPQVMAQQQQMAQAQAAQQFEQMKAQAAQGARQKALAEFDAALAILRSDKLRGFRVDIETDSTIAADAEMEKSQAIELFTSTLQGLEGAMGVVGQIPEMVEVLGDMLLFTYRRFRVGRSMESTLEEAIVKITERVEQMKDQPPPPSPEEVKAQAEAQKLQMEGQHDQATFQMEMQAREAEFKLEQQKAQMEMQMLQQKNAMEIEKLQAELAIERERLNLKREELALQQQQMYVKAGMEAQSTAMDIEAQRATHDMDREAAQESHQLSLETMEAKAAASKQQAKVKPKE